MQAVFLSALGAGAVLSGCGDTGESEIGAPVTTAETLGQQTVRTTTEYLSEPRYATADVANGQRQARLCRACNSPEEEGPTLIGPNLHGMFGAPAGNRDDYEYSPALADSSFVWTPRALEAWLAAPARFLPGNRMSFAGVSDDQQRADLVAYLLTVTAGE